MPPAPASPAVVVERLSVRFRPGLRRDRIVDALVDVDLSCAPGEIVGILGPNGSGKTTLFRALCGDVVPSDGHAVVLGKPPGHRDLVSRLGFQPDGPVPFPSLYPRELLRHLGALMGLPRARVHARVDELLDRVGIAHAARRRVRALSSGMQRRLAVASALLAEPAVLLLDEPTSGLDPFGSRIVLELLRESADDGTAVLLSSHRLDEIEEIADRAVLLHRGRKVAEGSLDDLLGGDTDLLEVRGTSAPSRDALERAARDAGLEVVGWSRHRRHPFELFRELDQRGAPDAHR